jgi:glycosyltransferase involved in cell wall biosynthesis
VPLIEKLNKESEKKFELTIVGDGPYRNKIEKQIEKSPEKDKINFKGLVPNKELPETYAEHDMFIYPGKWEEPFGRIFIESLSAGTPVISTPKGIAAENEYIIGAQPERLADRIIELFDTGQVEKLLESNKEIQRYRQDTLLQKIEEVIEWQET